MDKKCKDMQIFLGAAGPEYTLRKYVNTNAFSYSMQTGFHSFEMCQFRIQQVWVALPTVQLFTAPITSLLLP